MSSSKHTLSDRLLRYSAIASAATGAMLSAAPQAAFAEPIVIYPGPDVNVSQTCYGVCGFDFDSNGILEFALRSGPYWVDLYYFGQSAAFLGQPGGLEMYPFVLNLGDPISSGAGTWIQPGAYATLTTASGAGGFWLDRTGMHYVGFRYVTDAGDTRFAWIELTVVDKNPGPGSVTIHRAGHNTTAGEMIPASVDMTSATATSGLQTIVASAFAVLGGALTWLRRKIRE